MISTIAVCNEFIKLSNFSLKLNELQDCLFLLSGTWNVSSPTRLLNESFHKSPSGPWLMAPYYAFRNEYHQNKSISTLATDYTGMSMTLEDEIVKTLIRQVFNNYQEMKPRELQQLKLGFFKTSVHDQFEFIELSEIRNRFLLWSNYFESIL